MIVVCDSLGWWCPLNIRKSLSSFKGFVLFLYHSSLHTLVPYKCLLNECAIYEGVKVAGWSHKELSSKHYQIG